MRSCFGLPGFTNKSLSPIAERDALGLPPQTLRLVGEHFFQSGVPEATTLDHALLSSVQAGAQPVSQPPAPERVVADDLNTLRPSDRRSELIRAVVAFSA